MSARGAGPLARRRIFGPEACRKRAAALVGPAALALFAALPAAAQVQVEREELAGAIAGRACRDLDRDGRCSADEPGYPNLRLVLETGQQVITDPEGRYHLAAVSSRTPDDAFGGRLLPGRHRLRADGRGLLPGSRVVPDGATVEVPMAGLALQDFAVQGLDGAPEPDPERAELPLSARAVPSGVEFTLAGKVSPGERVEVAGALADVTAEGVYTARVSLQPGPNELPVKVTSPAGAVRFYVQRIDVVERPGGALIVPRPLRSTARVVLPGTEADPAAAGPGRVRVEAPAGTTVVHDGGEATVGAEGAVEVPVELRAGTNVVPLRIRRPGEPERAEQVAVEARPEPFVVALLDAEASWRLDQTSPSLALGVFGRGAAHAEVPLGRWLLEGELELRDTDLRAFRDGGAEVIAAPRSPLNLERALDPERHAAAWADRSTTIVPNAAESRVRLEARHPKYGRVGFGTYRAQFSDGEVGRYHRELLGGYAAVHTSGEPDAALGASLEAFASPQSIDPATGVATLPAQAEFLATGGSVFYLPHAFVARGSEQLRVVLRDGLTGVPVGEQHLVRGVDYELDALSGRILLARPLSFVVAPPLLASEAPTSGLEPSLVVDYEYLDAVQPNRPAVGGRVGGRLGPVALSVGAVREQLGEDSFQLLRGTASTRLGRLLLSAEAAYSRGRAHLPSDVALSGTGGLDFVRAEVPDDALFEDADGWALAVRLRGPTFSGGRVDGAFRRREGDFSDASWDGRGRLAQASLLIEQPLGPLVVGAVGDVRRSVDPRQPFGASEIASQLLGGYVGYRGEAFEVRAEAKDRELTLEANAPEDAQVRGGRTSVGAMARYRVLRPLWLQVAHQQTIAQRGEGPGAWDDSFSSIGADVALDERSQLGVRAGWGPRLGALAWVQGQVARGADVFYGSYSVDVDGPDFGERRAVSGARTSFGEGTAVFVEDVGAHDATSVRLARAVGLSYALARGWEVSARYERGTRHLLDAEPSLRRDAGGVSMSWLGERVRAFGRVELRDERGHPSLGPDSQVDRVQRLASAAVSWEVLQNLELGGRLNFTDSFNRQVREARLLEANAQLAWRLAPAMVVVLYGVERELAPARRSFGERTLERLSVMPAVKLGERFSLAAGLHAGWSTADGNTAFVLSGSLRPAVRVVGGLEVAAELARRSRALDEGELTAVRGELGYRFDDELLIAGGYSLFGYQGLGLTPEEKDVPRVYLRAEAAW